MKYKKPLEVEERMRFIFNFILFGVLFYAIYIAFPEAFATMVGWANSIYEFLRSISLQLYHRAQEWGGGKGETPAPVHQGLILLPLWIAEKIRFK